MITELRPFPQDFITLLSHKLSQQEITTLLDALQEKPQVALRYNIDKKSPDDLLSTAVPIAWCKTGYKLAYRPNFAHLPLWHSGSFYVQDASTMLIEQAVKEILKQNNPTTVLDLCAAPGGKTTHLLSLLPQNCLVIANEVNPQRNFLLQENCCKWGKNNIVITRSTTEKFVSVTQQFDILLIDAPCSGEGMFRKEPQALEHWSLDNVRLSVERQKKIITDTWHTLKNNGFLIYSTCTFNKLENENMVAWICKTLDAQTLEIPIEPSWNIETSDYGFQCYPHKIEGEGFFMALIQKIGGKISTQKSRQKNKITLRPSNLRSNWILPDMDIYEFDNKMFALSNQFATSIAPLSTLDFTQIGTPIGDIIGKNSVPHTALSLSNIINLDNFTTMALSLEQSLEYLHFPALQNLPTTTEKYIIVTYEQQPLGFLKNAGRYYNSLYPKYWRLRMLPKTR